MSDWTFVVLNWNGREDTLRCIKSIFHSDSTSEVIVSDNGSSDGSIEAIRATYPDVLLVENGANIGFSGGNNTAIHHALAAGAEWVVLVNNDATVAPGALEAFQGAARRWPRAGVLAGKLLFVDPPNRLQWAGQRVGLLAGYSGRPRGYGRLDGRRYAREGPVDRAVGAFMAVSRDAILKAGLLDEALFAYVEDVEWSLRIRAAGFSCVFVPSACAWHALSSSSGGDSQSTHTLYFGTRNTMTTVERYRPLGPVSTQLRRASILLTFGIRAALVQRTCAAFLAVAEGYGDARAGRLGARAKARS